MLLLWSCSPAGQPAELVADWPEGGVERELGPGESHHYRLSLGAGELLRLEVDQRGVDAEVALAAPDGALLLRVDRLIHDLGPELILAVAGEAGDYRLTVSGFPETHRGCYRGTIEARRPASAAERRLAEVYRRFAAAGALRGKAALAPRSEALAAFTELGEEALAAEASNALARAHFDLRAWRPAAEEYQRSAAGFARVGERSWEAISRTNRAGCLLNLHENEKAALEASAAAALARLAGHRPTEARALHCLGQVRQRQGELQEALDHQLAALELWPREAPERAGTLHNLGVLYARAFRDPKRGRELLLEARLAWKSGQERYHAATLSQLGWLDYERGELAAARAVLLEALALRGEADPCGSAPYLARLALIDAGEGQVAAADARLAEARALLLDRSCPRAEATLGRLAGNLEERLGRFEAARQSYGLCETLAQALGDQLGAADCLLGGARAERAQGRLRDALAASGRALAILEGVRPTVLREDLRSSFFAGVRPALDAHIDLLLAAGEAEQAFSFAEQARSRVLRDLLAESGAGLRRTADPELLLRERGLQRRVNALETRRVEPGERSAETRRALGQELDTAVAELEALRGELRRANPRFAALARPAAPGLAEIRRELLDGDTLLLELRLAEPASTLWAVSRESFEVVALPPRSELEDLARKAASWQRSLEWPGRNPAALCELSQRLLAPVATLLDHRRLVVVADGAFEGLSFAALPDPRASVPCPEAPALVAEHEIVHLPSAASLLAQRRQLTGRRPAPGWLAVVADPAYDSAAGPRPRLPHAAEEAAALAALVPPERALVATGAAASLRSVAGGALAGFRILHFATHGSLDAERPLLSALALADLDDAGARVEGALRAHQVYDLDLPAELVVLSACDTARGREVAGEGLVAGLPRAFLYAGAARVVVSLWAVEDESTRELMGWFYRGLFERGLGPGEALAQAQRALSAAGRPPRQWAAFVLLGDWRPLPPFER